MPDKPKKVFVCHDEDDPDDTQEIHEDWPDDAAEKFAKERELDAGSGHTHEMSVVVKCPDGTTKIYDVSAEYELRYYSYEREEKKDAGQDADSGGD